MRVTAAVLFAFACASIALGFRIQATDTIPDVVCKIPQLSYSCKLLGNPMFQGINDLLTTSKPITVLMPTDDAIDTAHNYLMENDAIQPYLQSFEEAIGTTEQAKLKFLNATIKLHILQGLHPTTNLTKIHIADSSLNDPQFVRLDGDFQKVLMIPSPDGSVYFWTGPYSIAKPLISDIETSKGLITLIDSVLLIPGNITSAKSDYDELFTAFVDLSGPNSTVQAPNVTVFIPLDEDLLSQVVQNLGYELSTKDLTKTVNTYVADGAFYLTDVYGSGKQLLINANGNPLLLEWTNGSYFVNGSAISAANILLDNGVAHCISQAILDRKSLTEVLQSLNDTRTFSQLLQSPDLSTTLRTLEQPGSQWTVFAVADQNSSALSNLQGSQLQSTIEDHIFAVPLRQSDLLSINFGQTLGGKDIAIIRVGDLMMINWGNPRNKSQTAVVLKNDIEMATGIVDVIDKPLGPWMTIEEALTAENLTEFLGAWKEVNMDSAIGNYTKLTIFALTDDEIMPLRQDLKPEMLKKVLLDHVVPGTQFSNDLLSNSDELATLGGMQIETHSANGEVSVNEANLISGDIIFDQGVIHVVDDLLIPSPNP